MLTPNINHERLAEVIPGYSDVRYPTRLKLALSALVAGFDGLAQHMRMVGVGTQADCDDQLETLDDLQTVLLDGLHAVASALEVRHSPVIADSLSEMFTDALEAPLQDWSDNLDEVALPPLAWRR